MSRMIAELIRQNRSCRRFDQTHTVAMESLRELVDLARLSASAANRLPLKYVLATRPQMNDRIFACLTWAAYLKDWPGPREGERPTAYILILGDSTISKEINCDHGIAAQSILLGAREKGLAGCIFGTVNRKKLMELLDLPPRYKILLVLAIGKPKEQAVIEAVGSDGNIRYWRDEEEVHHVPKRTLADIIISEY